MMPDRLDTRLLGVYRTWGLNWISQPDETGSAAHFAVCSGHYPHPPADGAQETGEREGPRGSDRTQALEPGRHLDPQGRFEDWQPLGEGTTAQVYAAVDRFTGRRVVLKLARDTEMARLFRGEVELLRRLASPVFPELLDFVADGDGVPLIVMERRAGRPLDPEDTRDLAPADVARLLAQLAQGLCELADLHHLHGDISPGNVLLDHTRVSLLDLGLARPLNQGLVDRSGTLATMAPERLSAGRLHGGGDVWSLGVLGWTLICGQPPFPEEADACVRAILDGQRCSPGEGANHPLLPLVIRCLEPDPEQRPTARELLHSLLGFQQPGPELVPRRPAASQVPEWCRQLLSELGSGHSGTVWGSGEDWLWLDWLQHESALAGLRLLRLESGTGSPLEWARLHLLRHPGLAGRPWLQARLLGREPLPANRAERRRLLNALLDFLSATVDGPPAGLLLVRDTDGETAPPPWLEDWDRLCTERQLPWVHFRNGVAPLAVSGPSFQMVLVLPDPEGFRHQLATLLPGLDLEPDLQEGLDAVSDGRLQTVLDALRLNVSRGSILWVDGHLRVRGELASPASAHRVDPETLEPALVELLAEIAAWSRLAGQALWSERLVASAASSHLARLEAEALVRNRGDGVPAPVPGLATRLQPARSERAHKRLLEWLANRAAAPLELKLEHLAACGNQPMDPELLLELAELSSGRGYPEARIRVLDRALQVAPPARQAALGSLLVQACQEMGQWDRARQALRTVLHLPGVRQGDRLQALIQLGHLYSNLGKGRLARRAFAAALASSNPAQPVERLKALTQLALVLWQLGRISEARGLLEEGVQLLTRFNPPWNRQLSYQANVLGALAFGLGDSLRAGRLWQELLSNSGREADPGELARVRMNLALVHAREDRLAEAGEELERAGREARELHFETVQAQVLVNQAHLDFLCGRLDEAGRRLEEAERICGLTDDRPLLLSVLYASADVEYRRGHLDEAFDKLDRLEQQGRLQQRPYVTCEVKALRLLIESDLGLLPEVEDEAEFIQQCETLDQEELLAEWLLIAASLGRPADLAVCRILRERLGDSPLPALLEHIGAAEPVALPDLLEEVRALPRGSWPLRDRLLLHLAARESEVPGPLWLLEELDPFRLGPFQQVHLGLCIGKANLVGGRLAKAGEQLGQAVNILRGLVDSRVMHGTERFRRAPVTQALARTAQLCQRLIQESRR